MSRSLSFEASWTVITASLIPKKEITRSLSDMGLCHFRKLLGYLWMDALPPLQWMSPQAGFVRGRQPAEAAFVLTRERVAFRLCGATGSETGVRQNQTQCSDRCLA